MMYMRFLYKTNIRHAAMLIRLRQSQIKMPENVRNGAMKTKVASIFTLMMASGVLCIRHVMKNAFRASQELPMKKWVIPIILISTK